MFITDKNNCAVYTITSLDNLSQMSFVPEKGGAAYSLKFTFNQQHRECLYINENFWSAQYKNDISGWPFLFPICGRLERGRVENRYAYNKQYYYLPIHGFACRLPWKVKAFNKNNIVLALNWNAHTFELYPFKFQLELDYTITACQLICRQKYINLSDYPMPYYAGFHPYFLMPLLNSEKEKVSLNFSAEKNWRYNKKLTDIIGEKSLFTLPIFITVPEINENLLSITPGSAIHLNFSDKFSLNLQCKGVKDLNMYRYIQLYTNPEKSFFCIEPWMSFPNSLNTIDGPRWLEKNACEEGLLILTACSTP